LSPRVSIGTSRSCHARGRWSPPGHRLAHVGECVRVRASRRKASAGLRAHHTRVARSPDPPQEDAGAYDMSRRGACYTYSGTGCGGRSPLEGYRAPRRAHFAHSVRGHVPLSLPLRPLQGWGRSGHDGIVEGRLCFGEVIPPWGTGTRAWTRSYDWARLLQGPPTTSQSELSFRAPLLVHDAVHASNCRDAQQAADAHVGPVPGLLRALCASMHPLGPFPLCKDTSMFLGLPSLSWRCGW
jgi:hypothetical protein